MADEKKSEATELREKLKEIGREEKKLDDAALDGVAGGQEAKVLVCFSNCSGKEKTQA